MPIEALANYRNYFMNKKRERERARESRNIETKANIESTQEKSELELDTSS